MSEWIAEHAWQSWFVVGTILVIAEMLTLDLYLLMVAVGAGAAALAALAGVPFVPQILIAGVVALALLGFVRPPMVRRLHAGPDLLHGPATLIGSRGLVTSPLSEHAGMIKLEGELWSARPYKDAAEIAVGCTVQVIEIRGATAYVVELPTQGR